MKRRRILRLSSYIAGGALVMPIAGSLLSSCNELAVDLDKFTPSFFKKEEYQFIKDVSGALLPSTETPGALEVGVPEMFDIMVNNVLTGDQQIEYRNKLGKLIVYVKDQMKTSGASKIEDIIGEIDSSLRKSDSAETEVSEAYKDMRGRALQYYAGSELVGTTLLNYLPVPGQYNPCIDLSEVNGKSWAI